MTKLEQYSPHLPYGVMVMQQRCGKEEAYLMTGLNAKYDYAWIDDSRHGAYMWSYFPGIKPYLRHFSQLTEEITQKDYNDGKPFVPATELLKVFDKWVLKIGYSPISGKPGVEVSGIWRTDPNDWPFPVVKQLLAWHFAIGFEEGEYIAVTTQNNVY